MSEKSQLISRLKGSAASRSSYIRAKINVLIPAQLRALRLKRSWTQDELAREADMKQSRVSAIERPGAVNFNMETLIRLAAAHKVGLVVKFVPFSELLRWENRFNQDSFDVVPIDKDMEFIAEKPARQLATATDFSANWLRAFGPLGGYEFPGQEWQTGLGIENELVEPAAAMSPPTLGANQREFIAPSASSLANSIQHTTT
jgi:transcriptional regulator with XRE-family HTH domain